MTINSKDFRSSVPRTEHAQNPVSQGKVHDGPKLLSSSSAQAGPDGAVGMGGNEPTGPAPLSEVLRHQPLLRQQPVLKEVDGLEPHTWPLSPPE